MDRRVFLLSSISAVTAVQIAHAAGHNTFCLWRDRNGIFLPDRSIIVRSQDNQSYDLHRDAALATKQPQTVLVDRSDHYSNAIQDIRRGRLPAGSVVIYDGSRDPEPAIAALDQKLKRTSIYYNIPDNIAEARNVHGIRNFVDTWQSGHSDHALELGVNKFRFFSDILKRLGGNRIAPQQNLNAAEWLSREVSGHSADDLVVIVSHVHSYGVQKTNLAGEPFRYPAALIPLADGSVYRPSFPEIGGPIVWIVGCSTWEYFSQQFEIGKPTLTINSRISYADAVKIISRIGNGVTAKEKLHNIQRTEWEFEHSTSTPLPEDEKKDHLKSTPKGSVTVVADLYENSVTMLTHKEVVA